MTDLCPNCRQMFDNWPNPICPHCHPTPIAPAGSVITTARVIRFECPGCGKRIKAPAIAAGKKGTCPACSVRIVIPNTIAAIEEQVQVLTRPPSVAPGPMVPIKVSLPKDCGSVQTQVSPETADILAAVAVGGLCVAAGVALVLVCPPLAGALATAVTAASTNKPV